MKRQTKKNLKIYACGALSGAILMVGANYQLNKAMKKENTELVDEFPRPRFEQSFKDTKEVEQYTFDYCGGEMTIEGDKLEIYSFDDEGNIHIERGKTVEVPVENNDYLLKEYISEREAIVYDVLKAKDKIKDQFTIYVLFEEFAKLYEEYLNRKPFETLENRKEAIYNACYDYIVADEGYTMGGYKFSELEKAIQKDILKLYQKINYMKKHGEVMEETMISKFLDRQQKVFNYVILNKGQNKR